MNKVVTINLNGFLFTIDELAYEILKRYLASLAKHFSNTEGGAEIVADIETRIAELLQAGLSGHNQVVQESDVNRVIALMGEPWQLDDAPNTDKKESTSDTKEEPRFERNERLRRDTSNKVIAGVCSGAGNYLQVDPVIFRLLFTVAFFVFGSGLLLYIILWIAIPASKSGEQSAAAFNKRRLYRDNEDKTIGGVCGGLGYYFRIDPVWFRIGFLIAFFVFGTGLMLYVILWIVLPRAISSAEKLRMKGEPVDINNIEREIKNTISKGGNTFNKAGSMLSELLRNLVRVLSKVVGFVLFTSGLFVFFCLLNMFTHQHETESLNSLMGLALPESILSNARWGIMLMSSALIVILLTSGTRLLFRFSFKSGALYMLASSVFFIGLVVQGIAITRSVVHFQKPATRSYVNDYPSCPDTLFINTKSITADSSSEDKWSINFEDRKLILHPDPSNPTAELYFDEIYFSPSGDNSLHTSLHKTARAATREEAIKMAENIDFDITFVDSALILSNGIHLNKNTPFQFQNVKMNIKVPPGTIIVTSAEVENMIHRSTQNTDLNTSSRRYKMTRSGLVGLDDLDATNEDEDLINMEIESEDEGDKNVTIRIDKDAKNISIHEEKNGQVKKTKQRIGPITIETTETEKHKSPAESTKIEINP